MLSAYALVVLALLSCQATLMVDRSKVCFPSGGIAPLGQPGESLGQRVAVLGAPSGSRGVEWAAERLLAAGAPKWKANADGTWRGRIQLFASGPGGGLSPVASLEMPGTAWANATRSGRYTRMGASLTFLDSTATRVGDRFARTPVLIAASPVDNTDEGALYVWVPELSCVIGRAEASGAARRSARPLPPWAYGGPASATAGCPWVLRQRITYSEPTDQFGRLTQRLGESVSACEGVPLLLAGSTGSVFHPAAIRVYGWDERLGLLRHVTSIMQPAGADAEALYGSALRPDARTGQRFASGTTCDSASGAVLLTADLASVLVMAVNLTRIDAARRAAVAGAIPGTALLAVPADGFVSTPLAVRLAPAALQRAADGPFAASAGLGAAVPAALLVLGSNGAGTLPATSPPASWTHGALNAVEIAYLPASGCAAVGAPGAEHHNDTDDAHVPSGALHVFCGVQRALSAAHAVLEGPPLAAAPPSRRRLGDIASDGGGPTLPVEGSALTVRVAVASVILELPTQAADHKSNLGAAVVAAAGTAVVGARARAGGIPPGLGVTPPLGDAGATAWTPSGLVTPGGGAFPHRPAGAMADVEAELLFVGAPGVDDAAGVAPLWQPTHTGVVFGLALMPRPEHRDEAWRAPLNRLPYPIRLWPAWSDGATLGRKTPPAMSELPLADWVKWASVGPSALPPPQGLITVPTVALHELPRLRPATSGGTAIVPFWENAAPGLTGTPRMQSTAGGLEAAAAVGLALVSEASARAAGVKVGGGPGLGASLSVAVGQRRETGWPDVAFGSRVALVTWAQGGAAGSSSTRAELLGEAHNALVCTNGSFQGVAGILAAPPATLRYDSPGADRDGVTDETPLGCEHAPRPSATPTPGPTADPSATPSASATPSTSAASTPSALPSAGAAPVTPGATPNPSAPRVVVVHFVASLRSLPDTTLSREEEDAVRSGLGEAISALAGRRVAARARGLGGGRGLEGAGAARLLAAVGEDPLAHVWASVGAFVILRAPETGFSASMAVSLAVGGSHAAPGSADEAARAIVAALVDPDDRAELSNVTSARVLAASPRNASLLGLVATVDATTVDAVGGLAPSAPEAQPPLPGRPDPGGAGMVMVLVGVLAGGIVLGAVAMVAMSSAHCHGMVARARGGGAGRGQRRERGDDGRGNVDTRNPIAVGGGGHRGAGGCVDWPSAANVRAAGTLGGGAHPIRGGSVRLDADPSLKPLSLARPRKRPASLAVPAQRSALRPGRVSRRPRATAPSGAASSPVVPAPLGPVDQPNPLQDPAQPPRSRSRRADSRLRRRDEEHSDEALEVITPVGAVAAASADSTAAAAPPTARGPEGAAGPAAAAAATGRAGRASRPKR